MLKNILAILSIALICLVTITLSVLSINEHKSKAERATEVPQSISKEGLRIKLDAKLRKGTQVIVFSTSDKPYTCTAIFYNGQVALDCD